MSQSLPTLKLHNVTPTPGSVVSVPVAFQVGQSGGGLETVSPTEAYTLAWDKAGEYSPIARGSRAHCFVAPDRVLRQTAIGEVAFPEEWELDILDTIASIKSNGGVLTNFAGKQANAYCLDYSNPYTAGAAVGLTNSDGSVIMNRYSSTRIDPDSGRIDFYGYGTGDNNHKPVYVGVTDIESLGTGWVNDGVDLDNMFTGYHKNVLTDVIKSYSVNNTKIAIDPADINSSQVEVYRGFGFETHPDSGNLCGRDILVIVDWSRTAEYQVYAGDVEGFPTTEARTGALALFLISWKNGYSDITQALPIITDPAISADVDIYPASPSDEFEFFQYSEGGGGGGGDKGHGGRAVGGSIPMRITSRGDIDYRHFLDLYDETNYPERNMFLTNFVGRIPYKLVDYDSSEAGGTGTIRVSTSLQFTHFVGASFTDANVPRVYEVISHRSYGGSPDVLECTFRVCYLKDYFQHFGVTAENEMLVTRSTYSGLYNPWLRDSRMFSENVVEEGWNYGSGGFNFGLNSCLLTFTTGEAMILPLTSAAPGYSKSEPQYPDYDYAVFYGIHSLSGLINCADDVDADPTSSLYNTAFVNALLSKITGVYMISSQMVSNIGSAGRVQVYCDMSYYTDPSDPENTLVKRIGIGSFEGTLISNPEWPKNYLTGFLGSGSFSDWTDLEANYQIMIPWYGTCEISGVELKRIIDAGEGSIGVQYIVSCLDGTISIAIGGEAGKVVRPFKALPKIPIPASSRTLSIKQTNEQIQREAALRDESTGWTMVTSVLGGAVGGAVALATGNPIAAAVAVGGGIAGAVGASISNDIRDRSAAIGSEIASTNIKFNSTACSGYEMLAIQTMRIVKVKKAEILNVYNAIGYPTRALWRSVGAVNGFKYWISILGTIRGTSAYAQAVRGEIERDGIIYNYS